MLFKEIVDARTHARTTDIEGSQKLTEHFVLRWAKKIFFKNWNLNYKDPNEKKHGIFVKKV